MTGDGGQTCAGEPPPVAPPALGHERAPRAIVVAPPLPPPRTAAPRAAKSAIMMPRQGVVQLSMVIHAVSALDNGVGITPPM